MADYYSPTVVRPSIPGSAITRLEWALLTGMFEHERDGEAVYFFASEGPSSTIWLDIAEVKGMLRDEDAPSGIVVEMVREKLKTTDPDELELELDLSDLGEAAIFQEIVRRSATLDHVVITSAWTCSKMRPDGFGGGVTVVTADHILSSSTTEMEGRLLDQADYGDLGCAPGHGKHPALVLGEEDVRSMVADIQHAYAGTDTAAVAVSDDQIRAACIEVIGRLDPDEQLHNIEFAAAVAAIGIARGTPA
ncbi:MAG: hypothetical protein WCS75_00110 [Sphingomonas sp.]|jgi:hypothetical protein|uniref:hypothetical protein n=1 Tax=Alphaproteobacteria TaxID=28211 RepID=UPI001AE493EA|nr:hypothetical protein [Sphingomonas sp. BE137]MDR6849962.1 hypothetical protein [Sphingomonas sp. BE137]